MFDDVNGPEDSRRTKKPKAINPDTGLDSGPKQKEIKIDLDNGKGITEGDLIRSPQPIAHEAEDLQAEEKSSSPSMEDIDSFTVSEVHDVHLPPKVNPNKRHASTKQAYDVRLKKRRLVQARSPSTPQVGSTTELSP